MFTVSPPRTGLLVVDMQRCFADPEWGGAPDGAEILERLNRLARACRAAGIAVIHTQHLLRRDGSDEGLLPTLSRTAAMGYVTEGHPASELVPGLDVQAADTVLTKARFGAFHGTQLEETLRARGIDTLLVGGIATNFCVETSVREAVARDFRTLMLSDGTTTEALPDSDGELIPAVELQRASCAVVAAVLGEVLTVDAAIGRIEAAAEKYSD